MNMYQPRMTNSPRRRISFGYTRRRLRWSLTLLGLLALVSTIASAQAAQSKNPFGGFRLAQPLKLAFMWNVKGEDPNSISDYQQGAAIAVQEINARGGVGGHPLVAYRIPTSPYNVDLGRASYLKGIAKKPNFMLGFGGSVLLGLTRQVNSAGIPIIDTGFNDNWLYGASAGSRWIFQTAPAFSDNADVAVKFAVQTLHAKKVAVINTNEGGTTSAANVALADLKAAGVRVYSHQSFDINATDLTSAVLAVKGADVVLSFVDPAPFIVFTKDMVQNQVSVPIVEATGTGAYLVGLKALSADQTKTLYSVNACNPPSDTSVRAKGFAAKYLKRYGTGATEFGTDAYDSVYIAAAAVTRARSVDPNAVRTALTKMHFSGGVCSTDYYADGRQVLDHSEEILKFVGADQVAQRVAQFKLPGKPKVGG
jgi:branched-chain amino acid transport system substrate-binding protein